MSEEQVIDKKEKLLLEYVLSNRELFVKCIRIMEDSFFSKPLDTVVRHVKSFFEKYNDIPDFDIIEAETDVALSQRQVEQSDQEYVSEELEAFCREQAMMRAVLTGVDHINEGDVQAIEPLIRDALRVKLDDSLGTDLFQDVVERIEREEEHKDPRKIGIEAFDNHIGHIGRGELGIFCAVSGGGKSLSLGNVIYQLSKQKLNVLAISLELDEGLYSKRLDTIITNMDIKQHTDLAGDIANEYENIKDQFGSIITKRMKGGTTPSDIRAFVMEYGIQMGFYPDVIVVDYLAGMGVDGLKSEIGVNRFDTDKYKSESLREIANEFNAYAFTAAQINREGQDIYQGVNPAHVQGGISMIHTSDWTLAQVQNEEDADNNCFKTVALKLRNEAITHKMYTMYRNPHSLRYTNQPSTTLNKPTGGKSIKTTSQRKKQKTVDSSDVSNNSKVKKALNRIN